MKYGLKRALLFAGFAVLALTAHATFAAPDQREALDVEATPVSVALPAGTKLIRDVAYGADPRQRFDVYAPAQAKAAPVIFMVHGGAWFLGDKTSRGVVENKLARWAPQGFIVISVNYRMLPQAAAIEQARDVARALAAAQEQAARWGGDRRKFILMGHSAGAHLVALVSASPAISGDLTITPWLGSVLLDSAALDVEQLMAARHARFYDRAFTGDREYWKAASPFHALTQAEPPILAVCSTRRDDSCPQARSFVAKAASLGMRTEVLEVNLSHKEINQRLGAAGDYTNAVERFMRGLDGGNVR